MKIAHVIGYFQPELGYEEYYLARKQAQMGHEVHMITSDRIAPIPNINKLLAQIGSEYKDRYRPVGDSLVEGIHVHRLPCVFENLMDFTIVRGVKATLEKIRPDVVHAHGPRQGTSAIPALYKKIGYTLIADSHEFQLSKTQFYRFEYLMFRRFLCRFVYSRAEHVIAVTKMTKEFLVKIDKINPHHIVEIPFGVEKDIFHYENEWRNIIRNQFGISENEIVIVSGGQIIRPKKLEILIDLAHRISNEGVDIKVMIIGDGDEGYVAELKRYANEKCKPKQIIFTNFIPSSKVAHYYSASDIAVWPNYPTVSVLEAMACRLPIIIPDRQLNHLVLYNNGFIFPIGDADCLYQNVTQLIHDKDLRQQMGYNSEEAIGQFLSYDVIAKRVLDVYEKYKV